MKRFFLTWFIKITGPAIIFLWFRTLRIEVSIDKIPKNVILVFWHRHIFAAIAYLSRLSKRSPITALVSGSKDGKMLQSALKALHFNIVEGSSSEGGFSSLLHLERSLKADQVILITPDGPKGPPEVMKPGALHVARYSEKPLIAIHVKYSSHWQLNSWDRALLPKPFSRCEMIFSDPLPINRNTPEFEMKELQNKLELSLHGHQSHCRVEKPIH
ncbi:DUF374 domain-containing protein [bacterium]|nr:DUF374 domain-containing protein [bacterium]